MEAQVDDPGRAQFRSVCPELFNDLLPLHTSTVPYRGWVDNSLRGRSICCAHGSPAPPPGGQWPSLHQPLQRARQNDVRSQLAVWHQVANGVAIVESGGRMRGIVPKRHSTSTLIDSVSCVPWLATEGPLAWGTPSSIGDPNRKDVPVSEFGTRSTAAGQPADMEPLPRPAVAHAVGFDAFVQYDPRPDRTL